MAAATHYHERITAAAAETSTGFVTKLTLTAAELSSAGFAINDDVIVLCWVLLSTSAAGTHPIWQLTYNGAALNAAEFRYDLASTSTERTAFTMHRVDLGGTITDFDIDLRSPSGSSVAIEKAEILVVKATDFGIEGTDWVWNEQLTDYSHGNNFAASAGNNARISSFTPGSVEDWVVLGSAEIEVNSATKNHEVRINLDSGTILGPTPSEEGEANTEQKGFFLFDHLASLAASAHTIDIETRDDASGSNVTSASRLLLFRADVWADIYVDEPGTVSVTNDADVQVATITDTLSVSQAIVMLGEGGISFANSNQDAWMWVRQGGSTVIDPVADQSGGLQNVRSFDDTDIPGSTILAYLAGQSGTLDLDLFYHQGTGGSKDLLVTKFLVWGMELVSTDTTVNAGLATETDTALAVTVHLDAGLLLHFASMIG